MSGITKPNTSFTLPSGTKYAHISIPPSKPSNRTLLFLHGFPSTAHDWHHQVRYFASLGYGIIAPDLLGYGGSSRPTDPAAYIGTTMAADLIAILDHENVTGKVIGISHDWGFFPLSELAVHHGERFEKYVFLTTPFGNPNSGGLTAETIDHINETTKEMLGYSCCGYWLFFNEPNAGKIIGQHWERFFDIIYPADPATWKTDIGPVGALKSFITSDAKTEPGSYVSAEDKVYHHEMFGDDYSAPTCWYKRSMAGLGVKEELKAIEEGKVKGWKIDSKLNRETLFVAAVKDAFGVSEASKEAMRKETEEGLLRIVDVDAGHWVQLEKPDEVNKALKDFFEEKLPSLH